MLWTWGFAYGMLAFVAASNFAFMRRPGRSSDGPSLVVLIPARNEAENLRRLLPELVRQASVMVFDDESEDDTALVARQAGATVISPDAPLPTGWTGKNRACHELGMAAMATPAKWFVFIDADVRVEPGFADAVRWLCLERGNPARVFSGFPKIIPGRGVEPLFLAWVGWILISTNPYWIVSRTGMGHNRFTNGQFHVWPREVYAKLRPNEAVKGSVLEDVMMGRLLAKEKVPTEVVDISSVFSVKMYDTWRETLDGMSKNTYEIMGTAFGSYAIALLLFALAWGWVLAPITYIGLAISGVACALLVRTRPLGVILALLTMPAILTIGAYTIVRSVAWRRRGTVTWKGRTY